MKTSIKLLTIVMLCAAFAAANTGCITHRYVDESGRQCERKTKFFIFFVKSNYSCEPNEASNPAVP